MAACTLAIYGQVWNFSFLNYDDPQFVTANGNVNGGFTWSGLIWAFTSGEAGNWVPLTWLSHMLDCQLFGLQSGAHHLMNVVIHASAVYLLFAFLQRITQATWRSAFVAFAFALHPLHIESVAWIAERKDVLCALFWMATLWAYLNYVTKRSAGAYSLVVVSTACALMAKPMAVTIPIVLLLLDVWPLNRIRSGERFQKLVVEKLPLAALSVIASVVTLVVQTHAGAVSAADAVPLAIRITNALNSYLLYIWSFIWPSNLAVLYPFPDHPSVPLAIFSALAIAAVTTLAVRMRRTHPFFLAGWLWFVITLVPVAGFVQVGLQSRADRYMYLPMIGLAIVIAWGLPELMKNAQWARVLLPISAAVACASWAAITLIDLPYWRSSVALFEHAIAVTGGNFLAYNNLGNALREQGHLPEAVLSFEKAAAISPESAQVQDNLGVSLVSEGKVAEAMPHLEQAARVSSNSAKIHTDLASALAQEGRTEEAESHLRTALSIEPRNSAAHVNLAELLSQKGLADEALPHLKQAIPFLEAEVASKPASADSHYNLGNVYSLMGRADDAIAQLTTAVRLGPDYADARISLGNALLAKQRTDEAIEQFKAVVSSHPDSPKGYLGLGRALVEANRLPEAEQASRTALQLAESYDGHLNLGMIYAFMGRPGDAITQLSDALRMRPNSTEALFNLGIALALKNRLDEAIEQFEAAIRLRPDYAAAHLNLGLAFNLKGRFNEARRELQEALRLDPRSDPSSSQAREALERLPRATSK